MTNTGSYPAGEVSVTIDGITYHGTYWVENQTVFVKSLLGEKSTQVGGSSPETIAMRLLSEIVRVEEGRSRQGLGIMYPFIDRVQGQRKTASACRQSTYRRPVFPYLLCATIFAKRSVRPWNPSN